MEIDPEIYKKLEKFKDYTYINHENIEEGDDEIFLISLSQKQENE